VRLLKFWSIWRRQIPLGCQALSIKTGRFACRMSQVQEVPLWPFLAARLTRDNKTLRTTHLNYEFKAVSMTDLRRVSGEFSVSGQLTVDALPALRAEGINTLICNRPDHEAPGQPPHADIDHAAQQLGMAVFFLPVVHATISAHDVRAFAKLLGEAPAPVHAWCRSGLRSITLWSLAQVLRGADPHAVAMQAMALGFDFRAFAEHFAPLIAELNATASRLN
jgi:uncharacterized protein (TIGR01244 family)